MFFFGRWWNKEDRKFTRFRAVDPHLFFADPDSDPAVFLNADPDPAKKNIIKSFLYL